jgi:hypothetical protein
MAERHRDDEPVVFKFVRDEKVRVKFEQKKAVIDGDGRRRYVEGTDVKWRNGTICAAKRVGKTTVIDGKKIRGFLYSYGVKLDDGKTIIQWVEEDRIEKVK